MKRWIEESLAAARLAWPGVVVEEDAFGAHVVSKVEALVEPAKYRSLHTTDLFLALACVRRDERAVLVFESALAPVIARVLARMKVPASVAVDLAGELRERLFFGRGSAAPELLAYSGRGPLAGWLRSIAVRRVFKERRGAVRHVDADASLLAVASDESPEGAYLRRARTAVFEGALETAIVALGTRDRNLLRQHHLDGLSIDALATLYGVHRATTARWVADAREKVLASVRETLSATMSPSEVEALLRTTKDDLGSLLTTLLAT